MPHDLGHREKEKYVDHSSIDTTPDVSHVSLQKVQGEKSHLKHDAHLLTRTVPIHTLPIEIITSIFFLAGAERRIARRGPIVETYMGWVPLMLVCRRWHNIGISTPFLWRKIQITDVSDSGLAVLKYCLSHAGNCTLDLILSRNSEKNKKAMPLLLSFAERIRSIKFPDSLRLRPLLFSCHELTHLSPLFEGPLPALEHLDLTRISHCSGARFDLGLSKTKHPSVRRLALLSCTQLPSESTVWTALRELRVHISQGEDLLARIHDISSFLASTPYLESFVALCAQTRGHCDHNPTTTAMVSTSVHQLNLLRDIRLGGCFSFVTPMLQGINAPTLSTLSIRTQVPAGVEIDYALGLILPPNYRHIIAKCHALYASVMESCFRLTSFEDCIQPQGSLSLTISLRRTSPSPLYVGLGFLSNHFRSAPLRKLSLTRLGDTIPVACWRSLQATFPDLRSIAFTGNTLSAHQGFFLSLLDAGALGAWRALSEIDFDCSTCWVNSLDLHIILGLLERVVETWSMRGTLLQRITLSRTRIVWVQFRPHLNTLLKLASSCDQFDLRSCILDWTDDPPYTGPLGTLLHILSVYRLGGMGKYAARVDEEDTPSIGTDQFQKMVVKQLQCRFLGVQESSVVRT